MAESRGVLQADGLAWAAGDRFVLLDVHLALQPGTLSVVWGDNGAGKSTLLELLAGLRTPERGQVALHGVPLAELAVAELGRRIARVGHQPGVMLDLSAAENVSLFAALHGQPCGAEVVAAALAGAGLDPADHHRPVRGFSRGMLQRTALARLLVSQATIWLLDEPATGLDSGGCATLATILDRARQRGVAIVVTTHDHGWLPTPDRWLKVEGGRVVEAKP